MNVGKRRQGLQSCNVSQGSFAETCRKTDFVTKY